MVSMVIGDEQIERGDGSDETMVYMKKNRAREREREREGLHCTCREKGIIFTALFFVLVSRYHPLVTAPKKMCISVIVIPKSY